MSASNAAHAASRAVGGIVTALAAAFVATALLLALGAPLGFRAFAVMSGSMEPAYSTGDLIIVREADPASISEGDVITYLVSGDSVVTHRVIEVVSDADDPSTIGFRTQGDANDSPDGTIVHQDNLIGTPVLGVPVVGYLVGFVQNPPGTYIAIAVCAIAVFLVFLPDLFSKDEEEEAKVSAKQPANPAAAGDRPGRRGYASHAQVGSHRAASPARRGELPAGNAGAVAQRVQPGYQGQHPARSERSVSQGQRPVQNAGFANRQVVAQVARSADRQVAAAEHAGARPSGHQPAASAHANESMSRARQMPAQSGVNNPRISRSQAYPTSVGSRSVEPNPEAARRRPVAAGSATPKPRPRGGRPS